MNQQVNIETAAASGAGEVYTPGSVAEIFRAQQGAYSANPYPEIAERKANLMKLRQLLIDNDEAIVEAIDKDFGGRSDHEIKLFDISTSIGELGDAAKRLKKWSKVQKRHAHWTVMLTGGRNSVIPQPKGVVGIVTPWNYPLFLAMGPLAAALAAGNRCMVKLAANSQNLCRLMNRLVSDVLPQDLVAFIPGVSASEFTAQPYNHLIFTGSAAVGKTVMKNAAEHLTPVTLELGGKSPSIIAEDARLEAAVEKVLMAKCYNAGQTCVAPDYLFVPESKLQQVVEIAQSLAPKWYPAGVDSEDLTSIVDQRAFDRLAMNLRDAETK
ncbi:MAG: aldehyde dehydrogenase family protein, partial [Pseudomonadota bacterium]|nr:aldehyde dehydrogenase family protein [Pseudomonadota bacterium]